MAKPLDYDKKDTLTFLLFGHKHLRNKISKRLIYSICPTGKALCLLTKSDLELRAPCSGDVIHNALQLLMNTSSVESPLTPHTPLRMPTVKGKF